ncbi:ectonucleoside triphosphate diphosphohydrolase 1-like protein [Cricetulus griseus]|uniref:Ectonucleoside triphosphate diphosphohydrolase 1 n=1 Tax=Cricetulus griseus TaxID=10029 RepID=A0A061IE27_CRIGR|nr:ectonucleoside triphosphate diphosphohydrolase 1-like protein [Cricetulus griseus]
MMSSSSHPYSKVKRFCSKNILIILGFSSVLAVIALLAVGLTQNKPLPENYGIVLDAGSSHTNLYIYKWPAEKENDTGVVYQLEECQVKGPGISKYAQKTNEIDTYLAECMQMSTKLIPASKHRETPVYLGATAGMRLLRMESEQAADRVLAAVSRSLSKYPFDFQGAKIITGQEEGAYGWITINYLLGRFTQEQRWLTLISTDHQKQETFGALDLGGASTQITFVPLNSTIEAPENSLQFRLYGEDYSVYTHSFLCYGKDQALWQKLAMDIQASTTEFSSALLTSGPQPPHPVISPLKDSPPLSFMHFLVPKTTTTKTAILKQVSSGGILRDPCFHPGFKKVVNVSELYGSPCTKRFEKKLPFDQFQIQGTGDYEQCQQSILKLFNNSYCPYSHCAFNGVFLPPLHGNFGAFSAFYFVMDFFGKMAKDSVSSPEKTTETLKKFCSKPWEEVKTASPTVKEKYLNEYCFSGAYILTLLLQGYSFTANSWNQIHFMGKIKDSNAGWTLGYMLNLTNMIPAEQPLSPPLPHSTYVTLMVLFSLILFAVAIIGLFICSKPSYFWKEAV